MCSQSPRDHRDAGHEGTLRLPELPRAMLGRPLLPPMVTFHMTCFTSQLS